MDLTGQKFGRWTVIKRAPDRYDSKGYARHYWYCRCECGTEKEVGERELKRGRSKSCGCLKKELKPVKDLTGERFGRWTVIKRGEDKYNKNGYVLRTWTSECDCGTIRDVLESSLKCGISKSCGCLHKEKVSKTSGKRDMVGKRFGRLVVREEASIKNGVIYWLCDCDCGGTITTSGTNLRTGGTQSCGCYNKDRIRETAALNKQHNEYDLSGEYGIGYTSKGEEFYFDLEDYDKIYPYMWYINDNGYLIASVPLINKHIRMHRLIMNVIDAGYDTYVDHRDHNTRNNRKNNLRVCSPSNNAMNQKLKINNNTGVTGVYWDNERRKWMATIMVNYKNIYLGRFPSFDEAFEARRKAENKYFGEWSYKNSMEYED